MDCQTVGSAMKKNKPEKGMRILMMVRWHFKVGYSESDIDRGLKQRWE